MRTFLAENLPRDLAEKVRRVVHLDRDDIVKWHRILHRRGWSAPFWPKEFGGPGWTLAQRHIFDEECAAACAPPIEPNGVKMVGPAIYTFGSPEQKARYLPRILSMDDWWCQGFSEPEAGSDLASIRTVAEYREGEFIVNGQKTWTTHAHFANMMYCLVRTDRDAHRPQEGISLLLIDMNKPGVTVRPIITIDGGHSVNDVFLDNVRVPAENVVGEVNKGWTYAKYLLNLERTSIAHITRTKRWLRQLAETAAGLRTNGQLLIEQPVFRQRLAALEIDLYALELTNLRMLEREISGVPLGPEASILKIRGSELQQEVAELTCEALGYHALLFTGGSEATTRRAELNHTDGSNVRFLYSLATTIYGGSNEVLKNVIAKAILKG